MGRRGNKSTRGEKRSDFSSFDNPIFEDQSTNFEGSEVNAKDIHFLEDYNIFDNSSFEIPIAEEPPKDQFVSIASTNGTLAIVQGLKTY